MNIVITGASRGIGLSMTRLFLARGDTVYGICRQASAELAASGAQVIANVDVRSDAGLATVVEALKGVEIDVLVNNAGILRDEWLGAMNPVSIRDQFETNALAPVMITDALVPQLTNGAKVALITSRMGSMGDNGSGGRYGYRMSKAALNAAGVSLARDLKGKGVAVAILHPGLVGTDMIGGMGDITPDEAAQRLLERIDQLTLSNTGTFWHSSGEELPW